MLRNAAEPRCGAKVALLILGVTVLSSTSGKVSIQIQEAVAAVQSARLEVRRQSLSRLSTDQVRVSDAGEIQVYVLLREYRASDIAALEAAGFRVEVALPQFRLIQGWLPADAVNVVAGFDFVLEVKPPGYAVPPGR